VAVCEEPQLFDWKGKTEW